jgi:putative hydrolase of the HAD superfamily
MDKLKNIKVIFFDIGWTLCQPSTDSWLIPLKAKEYFTRDDLNQIEENKRKRAFKEAYTYLNSYHFVPTIQEQYDRFYHYYEILAFFLPELNLDSKKITAIVDDLVYNYENFMFFPRVKEILNTLSKKYKLGVISDTYPSTRKVLEHFGVLQFFSSVTFSCDLNAFKPDSIMYQDALDKMQCKPEEAVFIDDILMNLEGAKKVGMTPILITMRPNSDQETSFLKISSLEDLLNYL